MRSKLHILAVMAVMAIAFAPAASATLQLTLTSGGQTFTASSATNVVVFNGAVGNWSINVTTGIGATNPIMHLNSVDFLGSPSGTGANALTIAFTITNLSSPYNAQFASVIGPVLAGFHSLSYAAYVDPNNLGGTVNQAGNTLSFTNPSSTTGSFSGATTGGFAAANSLYSLTQVVTISGTAPGVSSFDASIEAVPEPATAVLLGGVLVATFSTLRRRRSRA